MSYLNFILRPVTFVEIGGSERLEGYRRFDYLSD